MQTPQRPVPGAFFTTPAQSRTAQGPTTRFGQNASGAPPVPQQPAASQTPDRAGGRPSAETSALERAATTVNETLAGERKYPELDSYVIRKALTGTEFAQCTDSLAEGISSEYDISNSSSWIPFQRGRTYPIPDRIFEQYNQAHLVTMMGLFADLKHAWVSIDNALYLWDYTHPDPPLIGFEDQPNPIIALRMVTPRPGVFVDSIKRVLAVATTAEIILIGISIQDTPPGGKSIALYRTNMSVPVRGLNVSRIEGSDDGRIFFSGTIDNDVYEMTYQQEERWFYSRCSKLNHVQGRLKALLTPSFNFGIKTSPEHTVHMVVDNSRQLLYTLSDQSTIRAWYLRPGNVLSLAITKSFRDILINIGHMVPQTDLLTSQTRTTSLHPISSLEAYRLHLMAVTSTGCRIFLSATTASYAGSYSMSMQVHHIKFPPSTEKGADPPQTSSAPGTAAVLNTHSHTLSTTRSAARYGTGSFFCLVSKDTQSGVDDLFVSAPDCGRIARPQEAIAASRYPELGIWLGLSSRAEDIGIVSEAPHPTSAIGTRDGYSNEMAVQFQKPQTEIAVLTNSGVHTLCRQRLVDIFVNAARIGKTDDGLEGTVKRFMRLYGRIETAATALAVACGQGFERGSEYRTAAVSDPAVIEQARSTFIEYGGKPQINENMLVDQGVASVDMVRPSPRHDGLGLYISRLVRSIWDSRVLRDSTDKEMKEPVANPQRTRSAVASGTLRDVQQDCIRLKEFLNANKNFIDGLTGPEALGRAATRQQEVLLQAEHRALHALVKLIDNIIEGISFVQMLFSERLDDLLATLSEERQRQVRDLTYENLFSTSAGKDIAKDLVKAIVNRNILNGANVETVADALRRRCGTFCSPSDVVIFKAQENMRRAGEAGPGSELGRNLLNQSLKLFESVAADLSLEQLGTAVQQYIGMRFYGGAIQIALCVAKEQDRGNRALIWIQSARPQNVSESNEAATLASHADNSKDPAAELFARRRRCYMLIQDVITALDEATQDSQDLTAEEMSLATKRRKEAYEVIDTSDDEVFQTDLYDWYLERDQADRLLIIQSPFVIAYLRRRSTEYLAIADLLARYHSQKGRHQDAATVQLEIARSDFDLGLDERIEYLSRAKANASLQSYGPGRQNRQKLLTDVSELLDVGAIQADLAQKVREDDRFEAEARREVLGQLSGVILSLDTVRPMPTFLPSLLSWLT